MYTDILLDILYGLRPNTASKMRTHTHTHTHTPARTHAHTLSRTHIHKESAHKRGGAGRKGERKHINLPHTRTYSCLHTNTHKHAHKESAQKRGGAGRNGQMLLKAHICFLFSVPPSAQQYFNNFFWE